MNRPDIEAIRTRAAAAMPGPWFWRGNIDVASMRLASRTGRGGEHTVMDFERWGMQRAGPRFNVDGLMRHAATFSVYEVCPEAIGRGDPRVYRGDIIALRHADAGFIAHARQDVDDLLAYIDQLERVVAAKGATA